MRLLSEAAMSRRLLLSLLCLLVLLPLLVHVTRARGELRLNESKIRILLQKNPIEVLLPVENSSGVAQKANVQVELVDPRNYVASQVKQAISIERGEQTLALALPLDLVRRKTKRSSAAVVSRALPRRP